MSAPAQSSPPSLEALFLSSHSVPLPLLLLHKSLLLICPHSRLFFLSSLPSCSLLSSSLPSSYPLLLSHLLHICHPPFSSPNHFFGIVHFFFSLFWPFLGHFLCVFLCLYLQLLPLSLSTRHHPLYSLLPPHQAGGLIDSSLTPHEQRLTGWVLSSTRTQG